MTNLEEMEKVCCTDDYTEDDKQREFNLKLLAEAHDCDILRAGSQQLFLDLDTEEQVKEFKSRYVFVNSKHPVLPSLTEVKFHMSKGGNTHAIIPLREPVGEWQQLYLQALLCSDYKRETLNGMRINQGYSFDGNVLLKPRK